MYYRFDNFELDPQRQELKCAGKVVELRPKAFDLLHYLLDSHKFSAYSELIAAASK